MKIESGKLDRILELLNLTKVADDYGQEIETFTKVATIYAEALEIRTQDAARAGGRETFTMARFKVRWRSGLVTGLRIRTNGKLYEIVAVDEPDRRATMIITLEEVTH